MITVLSVAIAVLTIAVLALLAGLALSCLVDRLIRDRCRSFLRRALIRCRRRGFSLGGYLLGSRFFGWSLLLSDLLRLLFLCRP